MRHLLRGANRSTLWMLVAQGLNFAAMLFPALGGRLDLLTPLVMVSAIAGITCHTTTLAFASVHLGIVDEHDRAVSVVTSLRGNVCGAAALGLAAAAAAPFSRVLATTLALSAIFSLCQGLYVITTTVAIRLGDHRRFARARMTYALLNIASTVTVTLLVDWSPALAATGALAYLGSAAVAVLGRRDGLRAPGVTWSDQRTYARRCWQATVSNLMGGLAIQAGALATGLFGALADTWAGVVRITGGFSTIAQQVVAPGFDMRLSQEIRGGAAADRRHVVRKALVMAVALTLVTVAAVLVTLVWSQSHGQADTRLSDVLLMTLLYTTGAILPTTTNKFLVVLGYQGAQFAWVGAKLAATVAALVFLRESSLLFAIASLEGLFAVAYVMILLAHRGQIAPRRGRDVASQGADPAPDAPTLGGTDA